jgi:membrane protein DedA with SNARE-associated domain
MVLAFATLVAAGFGFPIPEELPTIGAGIWAASNPELGPIRFLILPICFLGVLISDVMLFGMGRYFGPRLLEWSWVRRIYPAETRRRTERNFDSYGLRILLFIRWLPAIRSPMFITAGLMRLPLYKFVVADGAALIFGHTLLFFLAFWFGDQFRELVIRAEHTFATALRPILVLTAIIGVAAFLIYYFFRHPVTAADPKELKELPIIGERVAGRLSAPDAAAFSGREIDVCHRDGNAVPVAESSIPRSPRNH